VADRQLLSCPHGPGLHEPPTPAAAGDILDWLQSHPGQVAGILDRLQVADGWELDEVAWSRPRLPDDEDSVTDVRLDEDTGLWEADVLGLGILGMYATAEEGMRAADEALVGAGWALVGGVPRG